MPFSLANSEQVFKEAQKILVGGVNSPVRAFGSVGGTPPFIHKAKGPYLWDIDGHRYIDYVGSWGPMILGHCHPKVIKAINRAAKEGTSFGAPTVREVEFAALIRQAFPSVARVRFVNSGTEATMSAIRLARGYTGRDKIIKFEGAYHGHADYLLVKAGSGATTLGVPDSAGVPAEFAAHTLLARYNDFDHVYQLIRENRGSVAAIILEPVCGNMGLVPPKGPFLQQLAELTKNEEILLIFDEVMTGFRLALGGAQELYGVLPDLTCLGKIIGGGMPVGAFGGREDIMAQLAPEGPVYQAGTLSGNPLAMAAGFATVSELVKMNPYKQLNERAKQLVDGIKKLAEQKGIPLVAARVGSMFSFFFSEETEVNDYDQVQCINADSFRIFYHAMLERGIYLPPSPYEAWFLSAAHGKSEIQKTLEAADSALERVRAF
jgi:glutamate-1-semialdehyde 2,1-aminomutase